jgi:hypothetical protein
MVSHFKNITPARFSSSGFWVNLLIYVLIKRNPTTAESQGSRDCSDWHFGAIERYVSCNLFGDKLTLASGKFRFHCTHITFPPNQVTDLQYIPHLSH